LQQTPVQGDAERNKVFTEANSKEPEFFSFYRSVQAYSKSLGGAATTLVLDPAWGLLKYFGYGVKSDDRQLVRIKNLCHPTRLGSAMRHTART
jgi:hypothetical protein